MWHWYSYRKTRVCDISHSDWKRKYLSHSFDGSEGVVECGISILTDLAIRWTSLLAVLSPTCARSIPTYRSEVIRVAYLMTEFPTVSTIYFQSKIVYTNDFASTFWNWAKFVIIVFLTTSQFPGVASNFFWINSIFFTLMTPLLLGYKWSQIRCRHSISLRNQTILSTSKNYCVLCGAVKASQVRYQWDDVQH